jgi:hypothetical protein
MASVAVTSVTPVTKGKCHACHAPRSRDISRDTRRHPLRGVSRCHACHAGLSFLREGSERDRFNSGTGARSGDFWAILLACADRAASLSGRPYDRSDGFPDALRSVRRSLRGQGSCRFWEVPQSPLREAPSTWNSGAEGSRAETDVALARHVGHSAPCPIRPDGEA